MGDSVGVKVEWLGIVYVPVGMWVEVGRVLERDGHAVAPIEWWTGRALRKDAIPEVVREAVVRSVEESRSTSTSPAMRDKVTRRLGGGRVETRQALIMLSTIAKLHAEYQAKTNSYKLGLETFRLIVRDEVWYLRKAFR